MVADGMAARDGRPVLALSRLDRASVDALSDWVRAMLATFRAGTHVPVDPGPMAPHFHAADDGEGGYVHTHGDDDPDHSHDHGNGHAHTHEPVGGGSA